MKNDKWSGSSSSSDLGEESADISVRFSRGLDHLRNADVDKAKRVFDEIIREDPEYAPAFFGLSCVHIRLNAKELARKFLEKSLELDPSYGEAHLVMARLLYDDGDFLGGYEHVNIAVQFGVSPDSGNVLIDSLLTSRSKEDIVDVELQREPSTKVVANVQRIPFSNENKYGRILSRIMEFLPVKINGSSGKDYYLIGSFFLALFVRLVVFGIIPIDWKPVSYHLWQIGYFTLHKGLIQGRMWDLHGVEYLYPIFPSLIQSFLMWLFRTSSSLPFRILNIILSSCTSALIYLIGKNYYDRRVGFYAAVFTAVYPGILIWNILNLYETMAAFFFVFAIYAWDKSPYFSGLLLALAAQSRTEFWIISFGACLAPFFYEAENKVEKLIPRFMGWLTIMIPFIWIFLTHTGNPIYPVFYGMFGGFGFSISNLYSSPLIIPSEPWRLFWIFWLLSSIGGLFYFIKKKQPRYPLYVSFLGVMLFHGVQESLFPQSLFLRYFYPGHFPLTSKYFLSDFVLVSPIFFSLLIKVKLKKYQLNKIILIVALISLILVIPKISLESKKFEDYEVENIMKFYEGGVIISDDVYITYIMTKKPMKVPAKNIIGSFYNPIYYGSKDIDSMISWFEENNVTIFLNTGRKGSSAIFNLIQEEKPDFLIQMEGFIYRVNYESK